MQIKTETVDIPVAGKMMRTFVAHPASEGKYLGFLLFFDIFQLSDPMCRTVARLAGYGFVVAAHEIFHRLEPAGTVLNQDDEGRARGAKNQQATPVANFDEDTAAALDFLKSHTMVIEDALGAGGFCIGGHLAFRAAFYPDVKATVCFYPTWLHNGKLGQGDNSQSLERVREIRGEILILFGSLDPLIPEEGRERIDAALKESGVKYHTRLFTADHGFVRDDRVAYDSECADRAFSDAVAFYRRIFTTG